MKFQWLTGWGQAYVAGARRDWRGTTCGELRSHELGWCRSPAFSKSPSQVSPLLNKLSTPSPSTSPNPLHITLSLLHSLSSFAFNLSPSSLSEAPLEDPSNDC